MRLKELHVWSFLLPVLVCAYMLTVSIMVKVQKRRGSPVILF